ncbi:hypothetical protein GUJ93_ZPchr0008g13258 [Zizania palustris]|uniref:Uncharacterized protein n=1 Tax=Zizania palustris TaxID=103762 RepID=A0A8J5RCX6_ZIZPA|nr:hypothetical protein GUJ93_ZPchr0008g13625 [Zizania palustris]KAG8047236.1 hypothetical protein GUJ93_ZPchr0008g13258 [Zizania palustris]
MLSFLPCQCMFVRPDGVIGLIGRTHMVKLASNTFFWSSSVVLWLGTFNTIEEVMLAYDPDNTASRGSLDV